MCGDGMASETPQKMSYASATNPTTIQGWLADVTALPEKARKKWHGRLYNKWNVAQCVRYVGGKCLSGNNIEIAYQFEVYKQPDRIAGGAWCPVISEEEPTRLASQMPVICSRYGQMMLESADPSSTFREIQSKPRSLHRLQEKTENCIYDAIARLPEHVKEEFLNLNIEEWRRTGIHNYATLLNALSQTIACFPDQFIELLLPGEEDNKNAKVAQEEKKSRESIKPSNSR